MQSLATVNLSHTTDVKGTEIIFLQRGPARTIAFLLVRLGHWEEGAAPQFDYRFLSLSRWFNCASHYLNWCSFNLQSCCFGKQFRMSNWVQLLQVNTIKSTSLLWSQSRYFKYEPQWMRAFRKRGKCFSGVPFWLQAIHGRTHNAANAMHSKRRRLMSWRLYVLVYDRYCSSECLLLLQDSQWRDYQPAKS